MGRSESDLGEDGSFFCRGGGKYTGKKNCIKIAKKYRRVCYSTKIKASKFMRIIPQTPKLFKYYAQKL